MIKSTTLKKLLAVTLAFIFTVTLLPIPVLANQAVQIRHALVLKSCHQLSLAAAH